MQLPRFVSLKPDQDPDPEAEAEAEDAFTLDCSQLRGYAFPQSAPREVLWPSVSQLAIVTPVWETQPWYLLLFEMMLDNPISLKSFKGLLRQENYSHPLAHLRLAAWLLSGVHSLKTALGFMESQNKKALILQPGESGLVGVSEEQVNQSSASLDSVLTSWPVSSRQAWSIIR